MSQPTIEPPRGVDPSKVIARLAQKNGDLVTQLTVYEIAVDELREENASLRQQLSMNTTIAQS